MNVRIGRSCCDKFALHPSTRAGRRSIRPGDTNDAYGSSRDCKIFVCIASPTLGTKLLHSWPGQGGGDEHLPAARFSTLHRSPSLPTADGVVRTQTSSTGALLTPAEPWGRQAREGKQLDVAGGNRVVATGADQTPQQKQWIHASHAPIILKTTWRRSGSIQRAGELGGIC